jgi:hypothetical protein
MSPAVKELGISFIRTSLVPPIVGAIGTWLINNNITSIDRTWLVTVVTLVLSSLYYAVFRAVELLATSPKWSSLAGKFLGYSRDSKWVK